MKQKTIILWLFSAIFSVAFISCDKENKGNETKISHYNDEESHNAGQNCMDCHEQDGSGEGWFNIAGTVYHASLFTTTFPNATVKLYTGPEETGTLKYTIQVDALGNFYSTETISFENGLYASIQGDIQTNHMISPVNSGQCNSCHGTSTEKMWTR